MTTTLTAKRLKVTLPLDPAGLLAVPVRNGVPRVALRIVLPGRTVTASLSAKSLRRAQNTVREAGPDGVAVMLQGVLIAGDVIAEAGVAAQVKAKPVESSDEPPRAAAAP